MLQPLSGRTLKGEVLLDSQSWPDCEPSVIFCILYFIFCILRQSLTGLKLTKQTKSVSPMETPATVFTPLGLQVPASTPSFLKV